MADEAALLKQLGTGLPARADGKRIIPQHATSAPPVPRRYRSDRCQGYC